ncbi:MAG TPA: AAA family ATPase [Chloroflexia bacterium]|nr:AAA family ATPase [Chloroflexia bacterium]
MPVSNSKPTRPDANQHRPVVISIAQNKGGTAKTTTTLNLGAGLAAHGKRVLLIDLDPQGNLTSGTGIDLANLENSMYQVFTDRNFGLLDVAQKRIGLMVAPAHISMVTLEMDLVNRNGREWILKRKLDALQGEFDYILIDCPPSLGLTVTNALAASDYVLLPVQTQAYALYGVPQLMEMINVIREDLNPDLKILGVLLTFTNRTRLSREVEEEIKNYFQQQVFTTSIRQNIRIAEAPLSGQSILTYAPEAAEDYINLAQEVAQRVNAKSK